MFFLTGTSNEGGHSDIIVTTHDTTDSARQRTHLTVIMGKLAINPYNLPRLKVFHIS